MNKTRLAVVTTLVIATNIFVTNQTQAQPKNYQPNNISINHPVPSIQDIETKTQRDVRLAWWREARFGMFIHWGIYSLFPAGGEWIMNNASIPVFFYKNLAPQFNPTSFSAHDIVALAKSAGMKYIVITAKHHDGFAMFDSKADPFNIIAATPFHRDPLQELAEECRKQDMKLGFYYSQFQDWTAPGGGALDNSCHNRNKDTNHWDKVQDGSFDDYLKNKAIPQIKELLTNYGDYPDILWFDSPEKMTSASAAEIVKVLNQYPKLIWNNRLGGTYQGDTETPEQQIPPQGLPGHDWETCMTMNASWGYSSTDTIYKSATTLLHSLIDVASKGGNYLLNISPDSHGIVPPPQVERLQQIGKWLSVNGEAIYKTQATLFGPEAGFFSSTEKKENGQPEFIPTWNWRSTTTPEKIYIEIFV